MEKNVKICVQINIHFRGLDLNQNSMQVSLKLICIQLKFDASLKINLHFDNMTFTFLYVTNCLHLDRKLRASFQYYLFFPHQTRGQSRQLNWSQTVIIQRRNHSIEIESLRQLQNMQKQGGSKEELKIFGQEYVKFKRQINELCGHNQAMINVETRISTDEYHKIFKQISSILQFFTRMNRKYNTDMFCLMLGQSQSIEMEGLTVQQSLLGKLIRSLTIFLKYNSHNMTNHGMLIWDAAKHLYCYQEIARSQLPEKKKDFELVERLKEFYAKKYEYNNYQSIRKLKEDHSWIKNWTVLSSWKNIYQLGRKIQNITHDNKDINAWHSVANDLLNIVPKNVCQEIILNNIKQAYEEQLLKNNGRKQSCCSVFFQKNQKIPLNSQKYNEYEQLIKMPLNTEGQNTIKKSIISLLNTDGGIHYIGTKKEQKNLNVQGIWIQETQIIDFYKKLQKIANEIEPENEVKLKTKPVLSSETYSVQLSRFVSVELNPLVDKENGNINYVVSNLDRKTMNVYLIKIKVKAGPKYDTYMTKNKNPIEAYHRNNGFIQKLSTYQFAKLFTERSKQYYYGDNSLGNPECPSCRHKYAVEEEES